MINYISLNNLDFSYIKQMIFSILTAQLLLNIIVKPVIYYTNIPNIYAVILSFLWFNFLVIYIFRYQLTEFRINTVNLKSLIIYMICLIVVIILLYSFTNQHKLDHEDSTVKKITKHNENPEI